MFLLYIVIYPSALITLELSFICLRYRSFYYAFFGHWVVICTFSMLLYLDWVTHRNCLICLHNFFKGVDECRYIKYLE